MATTYKTPGVYINEIASLPASVAQVETAIPAFIGYTKDAKDLDGSSLTDVPKRIRSMVEFEQFFGGTSSPVDVYDDIASPFKPRIILDQANDYVVDSIKLEMKYMLYHSMIMYFANGGGPCYIVSIGNYDYDRAKATVKSDIEGGITAIEPEDEPTILLAPDAVVLDAGDLGEIQKKMLAQCNKLKDRFSIFDLKEAAASNDVGDANFRTNVGMQYLKYGAAYGPWLETGLSFNLRLNDLQIEKKSAANVADTSMLDATAVSNVNGANTDLVTTIQAEIDEDHLGDFDSAAVTHAGMQAKFQAIHDAIEGMRNLYISVTNADIKEGVLATIDKNKTVAELAKKARAYKDGYNDVGTFTGTDTISATALDDNDFDGTDLTGLAAGRQPQYDYKLDTGITADASIYIGSSDANKRSASVFRLRELLIAILDEFEKIQTEASRIIGRLEQTLISVDPIYAGIQRAIGARGIVIPPSGVIAGIYAATDENRGVWKAPANVSISNVVKPTIKIDNKTQELLNVHSTGKSVNIIRSFTGKGVLVWGARTLAGNDGEWRYVPVRRLFITMEESIKKATEFVVFEPNDANTWLRTKAMIENYLTGLWRQGALAGAKPEDAFFVNVGLGETMSADDILNGRLIIDIGVAAVRPAEFIVLRFTHKLQES